MSWFYNAPYVSMAERKKVAEEKIKSLRKKIKDLAPIVIVGRKITATFWGNAWCKHLESLSDYKNRLPRGRSYVRNGFVLDLKIRDGEVEALVQGSRLYTVKIIIAKLSKSRRDGLIKACCGKIDSLVELLQGVISNAVMGVITEEIMPLSVEISFKCSCPDYACMCKHVAAVLYGIGARLDHEPEKLFVLRHLDYHKLMTDGPGLLSAVKAKSKIEYDNDDEFFKLFDIDMEPRKLIKKKATKKRD